MLYGALEVGTAGNSVLGTKLLLWLCGGMDGMLSRSIFQHIIRMKIIDDNPKITICRAGTFVGAIK